MSTDTATKPIVSDTINSLTGYEEDAIEQAYGRSIYDLIGLNWVKANRALVYVLEKRRTTKGSEALKVAQSMTSEELNDYFGDDDDDADVMPDEPESEVGKGDSASE